MLLVVSEHHADEVLLERSEAPGNGNFFLPRIVLRSVAVDRV